MHFCFVAVLDIFNFFARLSASRPTALFKDEGKNGNKLSFPLLMRYLFELWDVERKKKKDLTLAVKWC